MSLVQLRFGALRSAGAIGALRVDKSHPHDFFVESSVLGQPTLTLRLDKRPKELPHFQFFTVAAAERHDGSQLLSISLQDDRLHKEFCLLCDSLVDSSRSVPPDKLGEFVVNEIVRWRQLLQRNGTRLTNEQLRGLLAELILLERLFEARGIFEAVDGWTGPLALPQDFMFSDRVLEVKSALMHTAEISISSLEQLDHRDDRDFILVLISFKYEPAPMNCAQSVQRQITRIEHMIESEPLATELLRTKLGLLGVPDCLGDDEVFFSEQSLDTYRILPGFPRLTRNDVAEGITKARYLIARDALSAYSVTCETL